MKKNFKYFALIWFVSLVVFNAVTFLVSAEIAGIKRFDQPTFWIADAFITMALIGQLVSALVVCVKSNLEKVFLNIVGKRWPMELDHISHGIHSSNMIGQIYALIKLNI